jgi:hypothetical protein
MRNLAAEVLAGKEFVSTREIQTWVYVGEGMRPDADTSLPDWLRDLLEFFAQGARMTAPLVKWALILIAAVVAVLALHRILLDLGWGGDRRTAANPPDLALMHLRHPDVEELPADIPGAVRALIAAEDVRAALALLYRATLVQLVVRYGVEIPGSATEQECLALVAGGRPAAATDMLRRLTRTWQHQAYGHRPPETAELAALLHDWQGWQGGTN